MDALVTTEWLENEMGACDLRIVDASYHLADAGRNAEAEYENGHISRAIFLNLKDLVDTSAGLENAIPPSAKFASRMQGLGIGAGSRIVIYDDSAIKSSARAWFLLQMFGAHNVAILDGGLAKWRAEGRPLESGRTVLRERHFTVWQNDEALRSKAQVMANIASGNEQLIDARSAARFSGEQPDPRPHIARGHIPGSLNVPFTSLYNADGTFKHKTDLCAAFQAAGVDLAAPVVTSCGSGITACVLSFALHLLGKRDVALYDGSWTEWGGDPAMPKRCGTPLYCGAAIAAE
jgi:thiosulfate/3-mercaptopyruvate sulfurtransferase